MNARRAATLALLLACGGAGRAITETSETGDDDSMGCVSGSHNYRSEHGDCHCDPGYEWCDPTSLHCCPIGGE